MRYVRPYWVSFVFALIAMVGVALFETATGALLFPIFDQFMPAAEGSSVLPFNLQSLVPRSPWYEAWIAISILLMTFTVCKGVAEYFSSYLMAKIGQSTVLDLRKQLYDHLLSQSASFFQKQRTNFLVSRLVVSCSAIESAVSANLRDVLRESFNLIFFLGATFYLNWRLMTGAIIIAPIIGFMTSKFSKALRHFAEASFEGNKLLTDTAQEALSNHSIVNAYQAEAREKIRFSKVAGLIAQANLRSGKIAAISPPVIELVGAVSLVVLFFFGLREINTGRMEAAQFFTFIYFLLRSYDPMRKISRQHNEISKAFAAIGDVWQVLDSEEKLPEIQNAVELQPLADSIELKSIGFKYRDKSKVIIDDLSLEIPKGSVVALVGESGGGKSSLVKLIQRLYDPDTGAILWDGVDIKSAKLSSLKSQIALVTQETVLFNDTIRYNIIYGKPDAAEEQIREAARIAYASDFIDELPQKYDTIVGERGVFLSGGQRQRIAIARAVLVDAPVLILDEATSALDNESELLVQKALTNLMNGRTAIVIAHRLSTIRRADKIVVMERGKIVESGNHNELMARNGKYKKLYELQFASEEESDKNMQNAQQAVIKS